MKRLAVLLLAAAMTLAVGCSKEKQKEEAAPAPEKRPAMKDTSRSMNKRYDAISKSPASKDGLDLFLVREALQRYRSENGRYPSSLDMVREYLNVDIDLDKFSYDPQSGRATLIAPTKQHDSPSSPE